jgi:hypothetical protein
MGQNAEGTNTHKALGDHVEQEAADEFVLIESWSFFGPHFFGPGNQRVIFLLLVATYEDDHVSSRDHIMPSSAVPPSRC